MASKIETTNRIDIAAPAASVYQLAARVENWPQILPHYRYVDVLEEDEPSQNCSRRLVKMAASRTGIPVSWTSLQELCAEGLVIRYQHLRGPTTGMTVLWRLTPSNGRTEVMVEHSLDSSKWWLRNPFAGHIVGRLFVQQIASLTLLGIKRRAEEMADERPG